MAAHSESVAAPETVSANFVREFWLYPLPHSHHSLTNHALRSSKSLLASIGIGIISLPKCNGNAIGSWSAKSRLSPQPTKFGRPCPGRQIAAHLVGIRSVTEREGHGEFLLRPKSPRKCYELIQRF
eukprot:s1213_g8.t2